MNDLAIGILLIDLVYNFFQLQLALPRLGKEDDGNIGNKDKIQEHCCIRRKAWRRNLIT